MKPEERADSILKQWTWEPERYPRLWKRIADAISDAESAAAAAEREACAKVADAAAERNWHGSGERTAPEEIAQDIRTRGEGVMQ